MDQLFPCHMKVSFSGFNIKMPQEFLDVFNIHSFLQQMGCITVTQGVEGDILMYPGVFYSPIKYDLSTSGTVRLSLSLALEEIIPWA